MVGGATAAVELTNPEYRLPSPAHLRRRDVFGPAAAHLCAGVPLEALGPRVDPAELVPGLVPLPRDEDGAIVGEVLWVDRYGNCQLNIDPDQISVVGRPGAAPLDPPHRGTRTARRVRAFDELGTGQVGLVVDSYGLPGRGPQPGLGCGRPAELAGRRAGLVPLGDDGGQKADALAGYGARAGNESRGELHPRRPGGS